MRNFYDDLSKMNLKVQADLCQICHMQIPYFTKIKTKSDYIKH